MFVGLTSFFKNKKGWLFGLEAGFGFGEDVKENPFGDLITADGNIIGKDGNYATIGLQERILLLPFVKVGKILPMARLSWMDYQSSGPMLTLGAGFMQHQIFIADPNQTLPQLSGSLERGYDRMANGIALTQSIGYIAMHKSRWFGGFIQADFYQGFTQSRRFDYSTGIHDTTPRQDLLIGLRAGILLGLYPVQENELLFE